jgi:3-phosphoshikimate 1-carboxyvinyltransferase
MGASLEERNSREVCGEPVADIYVSAKERLRGTTISAAEIAAGIDEIPVLSLAGALCKGRFSVAGAGELRVKESDRLSAIVGNLRATGMEVSEQADGFEIEGAESLPGGCPWETAGDHRLAMTGMVANLIAREELRIDNTDCVAVSYPSFAEDLKRVTVK